MNTSQPFRTQKSSWKIRPTPDWRQQAALRVGIAMPVRILSSSTILCTASHLILVTLLLSITK